MIMSIPAIIILSLFCMGAAFVQRVSGFGFGIFIMTALPYLMPSYGEATTLSGLLASVTSAVIVIRMWRQINWRKLLPILTVFCVVAYFAVQWVAMAADGYLKRILGLTLIVASIYFFCISERIRLRPSLWMQTAMGSISGAMGGLFGMQGPPAVLYFLASTETKEEYIALAQSYFLAGNLMMTCFRARSGFLTAEVGEAWCYGVAAVLIGTWLGGKVFDRLPIAILRKVIYAYMAVSGLVAIVM